MSNTINVNLGGGVGVGLNGNLGVDLGLDDIEIKALPHITIDPITINPLTINTNSTAKIDLGLDNIGIDIKHIPRIDLQFGMREQRYHWPINLKFGLCVLGLQLLCFDICGENMFIVEDFKRHKTEECA